MPTIFIAVMVALPTILQRLHSMDSFALVPMVRANVIFQRIRFQVRFSTNKIKLWANLQIVGIVVACSATSMEINLSNIAEKANLRAEENELFCVFLTTLPSNIVDEMLATVERQVTAAINCLDCGNCCRFFFIHLSKQEVERAAAGIQLPVDLFEKTYVEKSSGGQLAISKIPCHFLEGNACTIYPHRFDTCREFPHLSKPGFVLRVASVMKYYGSCPIVFNSMEQLKKQTGFT